MQSSDRTEAASIAWREWSPAAFETAQRQNRPIFLYLYTLWGHAIHVFERAVLSHPDVVEAVNRKYVPIRVDSIRRPDVFDRYNQGAWPSICLLTPEGDLLFGRSSLTADALLESLVKVADYYAENHEAIQDAAQKRGPVNLPTMRASSDSSGEVPVSLDAIRQDALAYYDTRYHGFGQAPKFPLPDLLLFLLEDPSEELRRLALVSMETMRLSPLQDHLGGGFHRSCEDDAWRSPTFEKLLYDNMSLLDAYIEAYRQTRDERFAHVANRILGYAENALGDPSGLFYTAQDSDGVPGERAEFYGWTANEIKKAVDDDAVTATALSYYGISGGVRPGAGGRSFLEERVPVSQLSLRLGVDAEKVEEMLKKAETALRATRDQRKDPGVDSGMILMDQGRAMGALALAGVILDRPRFLQRAFEISDLVWERARSDMGGVVREFGSEDDSIYLADQVDVTLGLLELYRISGRSKDLERAVQLADETYELLGDAEGVGCFDHLERSGELGAVRFPYTPFDGNSRLLLATTLLASYTQETGWHERAMKLHQGLETLRPAYRMRDAAYGRALRRLIVTPPLVDLVTGEGVGEMRRALLEHAPAGTLIRAFDPDQRTPWTPLERYPSNGLQARAIVYAGGRQFEPTHDVDIALLHLNEHT